MDRFFARRVYDKNILNKLNRYGYALWAVFAILTLGAIAWFEWR
ncbi:MAG: hypothetical protein Q4B81_01515 [Moraxella sp.]|nr:hypothetical protein [Moraxella sp.]